MPWWMTPGEESVVMVNVMGWSCIGLSVGVGLSFLPSAGWVLIKDILQTPRARELAADVYRICGIVCRDEKTRFQVCIGGVVVRSSGSREDWEKGEVVHQVREGMQSARRW